MTGIGTLSEKSIHSVIKNHLEPNKEFQEINVGRFIADIKQHDRIYEIQTQNFKKLTPKIEYYLKNGINITVVYPVIKERYINWIDVNSHNILERRKSSHKDHIQDIFKELYWVYEYLKDDKFSIDLIIIDVEEYKYLDGYGHNNKKHATKIDKIPSSIKETIHLKLINDMKIFIPNVLQDREWTALEYKKTIKSNNKYIGSGLKIMRELGIIDIVRKEGNKFIYKIHKE